MLIVIVICCSVSDTGRGVIVIVICYFSFSCLNKDLDVISCWYFCVFVHVDFFLCVQGFT